jgi:hypothetical protein
MYVVRLGSVVGFVGQLLTGRVDSNLDSDETPANLLALNSLNCLHLFLLSANIDKAITLASPRCSPPATNHAGGNNIDTSFREERREGIIIYAEAKVGDKQGGLGGLANGIFTGSAGWARSPGSPDARPPGGRCGSVKGIICGRAIVASLLM